MHRAHIVGPLFEMSSKFPDSGKGKQTIVATRAFYHADTPKQVLVLDPVRTWGIPNAAARPKLC